VKLRHAIIVIILMTAKTTSLHVMRFKPTSILEGLVFLLGTIQTIKLMSKFSKRRRCKMLSLFLPWTVTSDDVITSVYGGDFTPSAESTQRREQKVQECIAIMGDKYRLAQPIKRPANA
jgi:hypothetical protein